MGVKVITSILIFFVFFYSSCTQLLICGYTNDSFNGYTCELLLYNPSGSYNFSRIGGTHLANKTNEDVQRIVRATDSNSTNVPLIICQTFQNTVMLELYFIGIRSIDENSFWGCKSLKYLDLGGNMLTSLPNNVFSPHLSLENLFLSYNQIEKISIDSFESLEKLTILYLYDNQIEELPRNVFNSSKLLYTINLANNKLKVIHSLGILPKLTNVYLYNNQIDAFYQNFIDDTAVSKLDMSNNICANFSITDTSLLRSQLRIKLLSCFENYENLLPEITTVLTTTSITTESSTTDVTLPSGCIGGSLDERVCRLEDLNEDFQDNFYNQNLFNNEFHADLKNQSLLIVGMQKNIEELEKKIDELANRPCACN